MGTLNYLCIHLLRWYTSKMMYAQLLTTKVNVTTHTPTQPPTHPPTHPHIYCKLGTFPVPYCSEKIENE